MVNCFRNMKCYLACTTWPLDNICTGTGDCWTTEFDDRTVVPIWYATTKKKERDREVSIVKENWSILRNVKCMRWLLYVLPGLLKKWPGNAAVSAHRSVIRLLSPVCNRKWRANASRLLNAWPHSLRIGKEKPICYASIRTKEMSLVWWNGECVYLHAYCGLGDVSGDVMVVTNPLLDWLTTVTVCGWCCHA